MTTPVQAAVNGATPVYPPLPTEAEVAAALAVARAPSTWRELPPAAQLPANA